MDELVKLYFGSSFNNLLHEHGVFTNITTLKRSCQKLHLFSGKSPPKTAFVRAEIVANGQIQQCSNNRLLCQSHDWLIIFNINNKSYEMKQLDF